MRRSLDKLPHLPVASMDCDTDDLAGPMLAAFSAGTDNPEAFLQWCQAHQVAGILTEMLLPTSMPQTLVRDALHTACVIERKRLGRPDTRLLTIGVLGSAGKTTTALLIAKLLRDLGLSVAYETDLGHGWGCTQKTSTQKTSSRPQANGPGLFRRLDHAANQACQIAVIEIPEDQAGCGALATLQWDMLVVTGPASAPKTFGPHPLDTALERLAPDGVVIIPNDPKLSSAIDTDVATIAYGFGAADVSIGVAEESGGLATLLLTRQNETAVLETALTGSRNAMNHAAAACVGTLLSAPLHQIAESLGGLRQLPGRDQRMTDGQSAPIILDVAGDATRAARLIRDYRDQSDVENVWVVAAIDSGDADLQMLGTQLERHAANIVLTSTPDGDGEFLAAAHAVVDGTRHAAAQRWVASPCDAIAWAYRQASLRDVVIVIAGQRQRTAAGQRKTLQMWEKLITAAMQGTTKGNQRAALKVFRG
ncbi:MAG: hypothetical protein AAF958_02290 [Planctomycetota bacterium]